MENKIWVSAILLIIILATGAKPQPIKIIVIGFKEN
ncbi:hypothetical protein AAULH_06941 [Lactobacillus helveticus MTCC 5463]|nr:hypothetical protein AAULH_06941 [Lactobacillus helveticus MTCC 5463]